MSAENDPQRSRQPGQHWYERESARLVLETRVMQTRFPGFVLKRDAEDRLMWVGPLKSNTGNIYQIALVYPETFPDEPPRVYPVEPEIRIFRDEKISTLQHQYSDSSLCLFHPNDRFFETNTTAATFIAKTAMWLAAYETWLETGEWPGVETKH
jgi:hypothetical protein